VPLVSPDPGGRLPSSQIEPSREAKVVRCTETFDQPVLLYTKITKYSHNVSNAARKIRYLLMVAKCFYQRVTCARGYCCWWKWSVVDWT
jgi:hypothetical protein